jgi:hypothetical protein
MALDHKYKMLENIDFPTPHMAKSGACNSLILYPLRPFCVPLSMIVHNTYRHVKDKENSKILLKLLHMESSCESEQELISTQNRHGCS